MYYQYWENLIKTWCDPIAFNKTSKQICGWTNPCLIPLYNNPLKKDFSSDYIPEPWWGNDGSSPLHSVVVNFNPGEGGSCQKRGSIKGYSYSKDVVGNQGILQETRKWHKSKRAMRVLNTLCRLNYIAKPYGLENHLSVELIPWHTKGLSSEYFTYLSQNIQRVYDHSICFAAHEASRIVNDKLHSVVIVRINDINARNLLFELSQINIKSIIKIPTTITTSGNAKYMEFQLTTLPDTRFICIWGKYRNDFPPNIDMDKIFSII